MPVCRLRYPINPDKGLLADLDIQVMFSCHSDPILHVSLKTWQPGSSIRVTDRGGHLFEPTVHIGAGFG